MKELLDQGSAGVYVTTVIAVWYAFNNGATDTVLWIIGGLGAFFIAKYEMTKSQWEALTGERPSSISTIPGAAKPALRHTLDASAGRRVRRLPDRSGARRRRVSRAGRGPTAGTLASCSPSG